MRVMEIQANAKKKGQESADQKFHIAFKLNSDDWIQIRQKYLQKFYP